MLSEAEREELRKKRAVALARGKERRKIPKVVIPDTSPALKTIASAVDGLEVSSIAEAIGKLDMVGISRAIVGLRGTQEAIAGLQKTVAGIARAVENIKPGDMSEVVKALDRNTAAHNKVAAALRAPKEVIYDEDDDSRPVELRVVAS